MLSGVAYCRLRYGPGKSDGEGDAGGSMESGEAGSCRLGVLAVKPIEMRELPRPEF